MTARSGLWRTLGRHQLGSIAATIVDFLTMVFVVELAGATPVLGTACGATLGGVTNFLLGRRWIFAAVAGPVLPQALRYAFVSAASAAWNTLGEYLLHNRVGAEYVAARAIVAILVSLLWNFPMQRHFVFRTPPAPKTIQDAGASGATR
jgi:putative flippase GtrA